MATKRKFYAVVAGYEPGIYESWADCERQVKGFKGQIYKSFSTKAEAENYIKEESLKRDSAGISNSLMTKLAAPIHSMDFQVAHVNAPLSSSSKNPFQKYAFHSSSVLETTSVDYEFLADVCTKEPKQEQATRPSPIQLPTHLNAELDSVLDPSVFYQMEYDGASKGNPGHAGAGAVIRHPDGTVVCEVSVGLGKATNNVAEYRGLIAGMRKALELGIERIQVQGDSKLVTMQVRGKWKINNENLAVLCQEAVQLLKNFKEFQIRHVDREYNCAADALANKGVGLPEEKFVSSFPNPN